MIRSMKIDDLDQVMELWYAGNLEAHSFLGRDYWLSHFEEVRKALPEAEVWVYEEDGVIQGFVGMTGDYLAGIFVSGANRSQRIGKRLLDHVRRHRETVTLHVYQENRRAAAFYLREGFAVIGEEAEAETGAVNLTMAWRQEG